MAKISNTTVYPTVTPADDDLLILTDATDSNKTKTVLMSGVKDYMNVSIYTAQVTVTSAEILNCYTQPVILIPGVAGKHIQPISFLCKYTFNTTSYTAPNDFPLSMGSPNPMYWIGGIPSAYMNAIVADNAFGLPTLPTFGGNPTTFQYMYPNVTGGDNVLLACLNANPTLGDGTLTFNIMYRLINA
jgi:hypothetical protein